MDTTQIIISVALFIVGIIVGVILEKVRWKRKVPWAGNVVIDTRRPNGDTIGIESPRNISHWDEYKEIRFNVIALWKDDKK